MPALEIVFDKEIFTQLAKIYDNNCFDAAGLITKIKTHHSPQ